MFRPHRPTMLVLVAVLAAAAAGCDGSSRASTPANVSGLPLWQGIDAELFGDQIDASAVGLAMEGASPRADKLLRQRAQTADVVARVLVTTVTAGTNGDDVIFHIGIQVGLPTLTQARIPERTFDLAIRPSGRAYPIAKAFDQRLRGMTFIGFLRRFAGDGEPEIHWHFAADNAEVMAAVKEAVALRELSGS